MDTLIDFFDRYVRGPAEALVYDDGFRRWSYSHDQLRATAEAFAARLTAAGLQSGDRVLLWSDSRPEWVAAFWGCVLRGVVVIPVDARASAELAARIVTVAEPRGMVVGEAIRPEGLPASVFVWRLEDIDWMAPGAKERGDRAAVGPETVAEIAFTSGTTGDPKGVVITHRNILSNITPVEAEVARYKRYLWLFRPIRFLSVLPLSHMFGQALAMFLPPLVTAATARHAEPLAQGLGRCEEFIWYRQRDFHTAVLPWYEELGKLANRALHPTSRTTGRVVPGGLSRGSRVSAGSGLGAMVWYVQRRG